ncbi:hypothetical protein PR003_g17838 [Phytophthora rubi]|uniref:Uncharacterized protein n=1 Tax=Phytophthora rubi TaxID=129364 RepID=A0A6A3KP53_9STRA|nr:hypothetical protein PR002_g16797 [Phytophthora rubi]KAE9049404.1 hypothetical protein PR001_g3344 [Phytophthora rubi]KAE9319977.1 hypothetical protein PR003_g17838 [Phytophthora rubi]
MQRLDDLPVPVLLSVFNFLHEDVAAQLLSNKIHTVYRRNIRDLAAVSTSWASAVQAVEGHFRDSILVFDFQQDSAIDNEEDEDRNTTHNAATINSTLAVNDVASGGIFQLVRGLLSAFACTSSTGTNRRPSEEEESREFVLLNREKLQMQRKAKHIDHELNRLLEEVTTGRQPRRVELWLNDPNDVTVHDVGGKGDEDVLHHWPEVF